MEEGIVTNAGSRFASKARFASRHAAAAVAAATMLAAAGPAGADAADAASDRTAMYAGIFAGSARSDNRLADVDGFADWGNPGSMTDYDHSGVIRGVVAGRKIEIDGTTFRIEIDAALGDLTARSNRLDPTCTDESAKSEHRWIATARLGVEDSVGRATVFATGGLAAARIVNSVTDIDYSGTRCLERDLRLDPDDSFRDSSTETGWVIGVGVEAPLSDAWTLRLDGSYLDFGRNTYHVNRSANNTCGGTTRRPCRYDIENRLGIVRVAIIRRFGR